MWEEKVKAWNVYSADGQHIAMHWYTGSIVHVSIWSIYYTEMYCCIVSVQCLESGCIGLYIPSNQEISQGPDEGEA